MHTTTTTTTTTGMPDASTEAGLHAQAKSHLDDDENYANTESCPVENQDAITPLTVLDRSASPLEEAVLACMPGAYQVRGGANNANSVHAMVQEEEGPFDSVECQDQQQVPIQTNIVSAYRVAEAEPAIIVTATPLRDSNISILIYGVLITAGVIALIVGLSVGLTAKRREEPTNDILGHLVSSVHLTVHQTGMFVKADRYKRTENGKEIATTTGSGVYNWCEVVPCIQGGCNFLKNYKPGCCLGDNCSRSDKCGGLCPSQRDLCFPSFDGCTDATCFECERGPNGEELYRFRAASYNINCLRTGVSTGFNDKDDKVERIYKWAITCGYNIQGGYEWLNQAAGEYMCIAYRVGDGITKTLSIPLPCQLIQLGECGCAPDEVHTFGLPSPEKPCKTEDDCPYLCGDAGEEKAKTLCEAFPGIEYWEGENPLHSSAFVDPNDAVFGNVTITIEIYGD